MEPSIVEGTLRSGADGSIRISLASPATRTRKSDNSNGSAVVVVLVVVGFVVVFWSLLLVTKLPLPTLALPLSRLTDETPVLIVYSGSLEDGGGTAEVALFSLAIVRIPFLLVTELSGM